MTAPLETLPSPAIGVLKKVAVAVALLAVVVLIAGRRFGWLDYRPGGASFDIHIVPAFATLLVVALLVALKWEVAGGALAGFAAAGLMAFATRQLIAPHAAGVVALFAIPAVLWLVIDIAESSRRGAVIGIGMTLLLAVAGFVVGQRVYGAVWGPTHPESAVPELADSAIEWVWSGAVTSTGAEVRARVRVGGSARLAVSTSGDLSSPRWFEPSDPAARA